MVNQESAASMLTRDRNALSAIPTAFPLNVPKARNITVAARGKGREGALKYMTSGNGGLASGPVNFFQCC